jgi:phosphatidylglycerol:prolipoprotein diacylglycerol transferase
MHPVLLKIPLPNARLPLSWPLVVIALLGAAIALLGFRRKSGDLVVIGSVIAVAGIVFAFSFWHKSIALIDLPIESYGAMLCVALVVGHQLTLALAHNDGLSRDETTKCFVVAVITGLVGARLLYVLENFAQHARIADVLALRRGGLALYGGLLGGLAGSWIYLRSKRTLLAWADAAAPGAAFAVVIGRIGCYLFGCDFGRPLAAGAPRWLSALGRFPRWSEGTLPEVSGSPAWLRHVTGRGLSSDSAASLPVHPTQLYEAAAGVMLVGLVFYVRKRRSFEGEVFLAFVFGYGVLRFIVEILRDDAERGSFGPHLAEHLYVALALAAFAVAFSYGPARALHGERAQRLAQALSLLPAVASFLLLRPADAAAAPVQLSTAQWLALLSALAVAAAWSALQRAARARQSAHNST